MDSWRAPVPTCPSCSAGPSPIRWPWPLTRPRPCVRTAADQHATNPPPGLLALFTFACAVRPANSNKASKPGKGQGNGRTAHGPTACYWEK